MLERVVMRVGADRAVDAESALVAQAALLTLSELMAVLRRTEAYLDPDGLETVIAAMHDERAFRISQDATGMTVLHGRFGPESAAPIRAAIEAMVAQQLRASRGATGGTVYFIPPAHIDPGRTPRLGGRKRFDAAWGLVA